MNKPRKRYSKSGLTPAKKKFAGEYARTDNATLSVLNAFPEIKSKEVAAVKGYRLLRNDQVLMDIQQQREKLEEISSRAVERIGELVESEDEQVAGQNSRFVLEQVHGKATQRVESRSAHVFVSYDLSGGQAGEVPPEILAQLQG